MPPTAPFPRKPRESQLSPRLCEFIDNVLVPVLLARYLASHGFPDDPRDEDQDLPIAA
jgi:hypothetical protein